MTKAFGSTRVLEGLDLRIEAGEVFALLGPNGAGKTTTVRILSTLLTPDGGIARSPATTWCETPTPCARRSASPPRRPRSTAC